MKKKYFLTVGLVLIVSFFFLKFGKELLEWIFQNYLYMQESDMDFYSRNIMRFLFIVTLLLFIKKADLINYNGLDRIWHIRDKWVLFLPVFFVTAGFWVNWPIYVQADNTLVTIKFIDNLFIGLSEEILFRGIILALFLSMFMKTSLSLYRAVLASSILFGLIHYTNYRISPDFWDVTSQVLYAIPVGIFLSALMLRTGNVLVPALFHASVNMLFGHGLSGKEIPPRNLESLAGNGSIEWVDLIGTAILFLLIFGIGLNMIRLVDKEEVMRGVRKLKFPSPFHEHSEFNTHH